MDATARGRTLDRAQEVSGGPSAPRLFAATACEPPPAQSRRDEPVTMMRELVNASLDYVVAAASYHRNDRLFPTGPSGSATTPLGVGHGACGVAHVLQQVRGACPARVVEWIRRRSIDASDYPPGLTQGLAGIAWTLWDLGVTDEAEKTMAMAFSHPRLLETADVCDGISGVGLAALWMHVRTGDPFYVDRARWLAGCLSSRAEQQDAGVCWRSADHRVRVGYGRGSSGVAAFLLYLYLATGEWRWLQLGRRALAFDLHRASIERGRFTDRSRHDTGGGRPASWEHGAAGIGGVLARYYAVLGCESDQTTLRAMVKQTIEWESPDPGYFLGLAGSGQFFLDLAILCGSREAERRAIRIGHAIASYAVRTPAGVVFASESHPDIDCGFGTGGAGVALFLHRLLATDTSSFMLDELFDLQHLQNLA